MIVTNDEATYKKVKHVTTTSKVPHDYEYIHDELGYNYRMPNLNAALGCAQMEQLPNFILKKRELADVYRAFFDEINVPVLSPLARASPNYWLNTIILPGSKTRDRFISFTNGQGVMTRPAWRLMTKLPMFKHCETDGIKNSIWLSNRIVNIPSSVPEI